ncbi:glycosyltransferase [Ornithinicoccus halotolerans]|uniref:glycosyltransferase n=1 Tax=Ornithinicoccus halotolerans TaxID=1748220 RepID=UPI001294D810|nr:glycosyltransferase [Ornithinicoccus halotolerans]
MRVLAVTTWLPSAGRPGVGGFVVRDAAAIASRGHDVHLVHLVPPEQVAAGDRLHPDRDQVGGLPVSRVPMGTQRPDQVLRAGAVLRGLARHADLVHTMAFSSLLPLAWWRPSGPWVHTEHWSGLTAPQTLPRSWRAMLPALRPLLGRPDVVTTVVDYLAQPVRAVRGGRPTVVVPCIVPPLERVPERRGGGDGEIRLVSVGALVERKDPVLAVEVVAELRRRGRPARLTLVGEGELAAAVRQRAAALGVADGVRLTGSLDRSGVLAELADADLFLGPTRGDNFFVSCAEALVSGRPVVVGSTGGQGEYIAPRVGETVPVQEPGAYADAVERVLAGTAGMTAGQIAATVGDRFDPDTVGRGYDEGYALAAQVWESRG